MPDEVTFEIPGECRGKGAPRAFVFMSNGKPEARIHKDTKDKKWMEHVAKLALNVAPSEPWKGPVSLHIVVNRALLQEHLQSATKRDRALRGRILPTSRPDCDNYSKGIADALSGIVYHDDAQIVALVVVKQYAAVARTIVTVRRIEDAEFEAEKLIEAQGCLF